VLITAVNSDNVAQAQAAIHNGCPIGTALDGSGATALTWSQSLAMTRMLLAEGADANQVGNLKESALGVAAFHGNIEMVNALLAAGAHPNVPGTWECGPLCEAISSSSPAAPQIVQRLLAAQASPDETNCFHVSALFKAVQVGRSAMVTDLLTVKAEPNIYETTRGDPLIVVATGTGKQDIVAALLNAHANPNWPNPRSCRSALHVAAAAGNLALVQLLVSHSADTSATDNGGVTARGLAQSGGHADVAAFLATRGAALQGIPNSDCVNEANTPEAVRAWNAARQRTREPMCADVTHAVPRPQGSGR
jgi:ankyrin repeat protein